MINYIKIICIASILASASPVKADFGDADFPIGLFEDSSKRYHDAWCRKLKNQCRIRFQGPSMWVEGKGGIHRSQFIGYRFDQVLSQYGSEFYNYITYIGKKGRERTALFLFANKKAQGQFMRAYLRWKRQDSSPIPNYRFPASQGPQETYGRDKGLNPYDNPPITDWKEKTSE